MQHMPTLDHTLHQITDQVRAAQADGTRLRIRGGGSKDFYGHSLQGALLDTTGLNSILSYEPSELVVTTGAGTPLAELEAVLAERGQSLAFEPPHFQWSTTTGATVGGMVAAGLSGPARANAGAVREYVLGLHMLNGLGEALVFGGQVMKNVAGYDLSRMMVGSMGTLGLITQVSLKVLPVAPAEATLRFATDQASALECLHRWGGKPLPLNASCWLNSDSSVDNTPGWLYLRLRGAKAAVEAACHALLAEQGGERLDPSLSQRHWQDCRNQQLPFFTQSPNSAFGLWRLSLPQVTPVLDLPWPQLVEWHGALRWLWAPLNAAERLQTLAQSLGGYASLFVPPNAAPAPVTGPVALTNPTHLAIQHRLKHSLDPHGIFNPQRLFSTW